MDISYPTKKEIQPGDILISHTKNVASEIPQLLAQKLGRGPANMFHASIALSQHDEIHMTYGNLAVSEISARRKTEVFRCRTPHIASEALSVAQLLALKSKEYRDSAGFDGMETSFKKWGMKGKNFAPFARSKLKSKLQFEKFLSKLENEKSSSFFCSSFVVYCYQIAAEATLVDNGFLSNDIKNTFKRKCHTYTPANLWDSLNKSYAFDLVGTYQKGRYI